MKRIEEYLQKMEKKERVMLYLSFPILIFIFYFNFVYNPFVDEENKLDKNKRNLIKKISTIKSNKMRYNALQKEYYRLQTDIESLLQDYRYSRISFNSLEVMKLSESKFLSIIEYLLSKAKKRKIDVSLDIDKNIEVNKHFNNTISITIKGKSDYINFVKYIKDIENINSLIIFDKVNIKEIAKDIKDVKKIKEANKTPFSMEVSFSKIEAIEFMKLLSDRAKSMKISLNTTLKNMNVIYVSGKGEYRDVNNFIKYLKRLKDIKVSNLNVSLSNVVNLSKIKKSVNRKEFEIKFKLVGIK